MGLVTVCLLPVAAHAETADQMVRQTSREVLDIIKKENGKNTARIRAEVETAAVGCIDGNLRVLRAARGGRSYFFVIVLSIKQRVKYFIKNNGC